MNKINLIEQGDLEPIEGDTSKTPDLPIDDLDLEEITNNEDEEMGDKEYQYTLTVKQQGDDEGEKNLEPEFVFILTPKGEEEETEGDLETIEDTSAGIENTQAPETSVAPAALPESVWNDLETITEQEAPISAAGGENTPPPPAAPAQEASPEPLPEEEPELEPTTTELSEEEIKSFIDGSGVEIKFSMDEETEFSIEEAIDYLKIYPDTEIFVTVSGDLEEFKTKLDEFQSEKEGALEEAGTEEQNVMVDNEGETLDMKNTPQANPATPTVPRESFSVFNMRNKKNLPDGIYVAHLLENKLYGRIDLKLTSGKLVIGNEVFALEEKLNIAESKGKESIELVLKESDVENLVKILNEKADIIVKL